MYTWLTKYRVVRDHEWLKIFVDANCHEKRIDECLKREWPVSKQIVKQLIREQGIQINGNPAPIQRKVYAGDEVALKLYEEEPFGVTPNQHVRNFDIAYEDDAILVVNKGVPLDVHPNGPNDIHSLASGIAYYYEQTNQQHKIRHVHRLDKETSGLLLFAKDGFTQSLLDEELRQKTIIRHYYALVYGQLAQSSGVIDAPIGRDRHHKSKRIVSKSGDPARTHFEVIQTYKQATLVSVWLETGRTHQIRVHFQSIGHPLIGDPLYGEKGGIPFSRQALHSKELTFVHPYNGEKMTISSELPNDLKALIHSLS